MKTFSLLAAILALGFTLAVGDAEAKRLGGGQSSGMQRQATAPSAAPAANRAPAAAPAPQAQPKRSWMGPLAGLAAGLGLAALASHFGFGEGLANMMMIGLLVMAVVLAIGFIMRRRAAAQQPATAGADGLQYATSGVDAAAARPGNYDLSLPASGAGAPLAAGNIPADFDVEAFQRNAKVNFIRLQAANDAGNLDDIREFTTPEMFAEIKLAIAERNGAAQQTDVVSINAQVTDVAEEATRYIVSVRFAGLIREEKNGPAEPIDEIWNLVKSRDGKGGWLLAGIQQMQ